MKYINEQIQIQIQIQKKKNVSEICHNSKRWVAFQRFGVSPISVYPVPDSPTIPHHRACQKSEGIASDLRQPLLPSLEAPPVAAVAPRKSFAAIMLNRDTGGSRSVALTWPACLCRFLLAETDDPGILCVVSSWRSDRVRAAGRAELHHLRLHRGRCRETSTGPSGHQSGMRFSIKSFNHSIIQSSNRSSDLFRYLLGMTAWMGSSLAEGFGCGGECVGMPGARVCSWVHMGVQCNNVFPDIIQTRPQMFVHDCPYIL